MTTAPERFDLEREISDRIIAAIEAGTPPWRKPWTGAPCPLPRRANGEPYRGINVLMLWMEAASRGYASPFWMTYKQAQELGAQVRKGETSSLVVKFGVIEREREDGGEDRFPYLKGYRVFNAAQIDGLPETFAAPEAAPIDLGTEPEAALAAYFDRLGAAVETTPDPRAYYDPARDLIHLPPVGTFHDAQGYYQTLGHEAVHWTGGPARLDRLARFRERTAYAFEELVAEIGQCLLFATLGREPSIDQSAAYVEGWLRALASDKKAIFRAASEAQKAVDLITERCGATLAGHAPEQAEAA